MEIKSWTGMVYGLLALLAASLACSFSGSTDLTSRGEQQKFNQAGFSFAPPAGTSVSDLGIFGVVVKAPNVEMAGDEILGPACTASTTERAGLKASQQNFWIERSATVKVNYGLLLSDAQVTSAAGQFALAGEVNGNYLASVDPKGRAAYGKLLVISINEKRMFDLMCLGLANRKAETASLFDKLKASVNFYDPVIPTLQK